MKNRLLIFLWVLLLPGLALAQSNLSLSFSNSSVEVNNLNTSSFDPYVPSTQPILTYLLLSNSGAPTRVDLKVRISWNDNPLVESTFESIDSLGANDWTLTNRDLITNQSSNYFINKGGETISVDAVVQANTILHAAVLAGYFPDGDLQIRVWMRPWEEAAWVLPENAPGYKQFTIRIRNAGFIDLLSPGVEVGSIPPPQNGAPLSFLWNSLNTGINKYRLIIREYAPNYPPDRNTVATTGNLFYETPDVVWAQSGFADYLPFNPGNYYAWQVQTVLANEFAPINAPNTSNQFLNSKWFVFRYVGDNEANNSLYEFQARLNMLNNNTLLNLYTQGYQPVGVIIYEGRTYSGQDAYDLIDSLMGQDIKVELKE